MNKLTDWFPGDVNPTREGVYETRTEWRGAPAGRFYRYWDGVNWFGGMSTVDGALNHEGARSEPTSFDIVQWRGIDKQPSPIAVIEKMVQECLNNDPVGAVLTARHAGYVV